MVQRLKTWEPVPTTLRMASFLQHIYILCELKGRGVASLERALKGAQDSTVLEGSVVWEALRIWLSNEDNLDKDVSGLDLHKGLTHVSGMNGIDYTKECGTPKKLAWKMKDLAPNLSGYKLEFNKGSKALLYKFSRDTTHDA